MNTQTPSMQLTVPVSNQQPVQQPQFAKTITFKKLSSTPQQTPTVQKLSHSHRTSSDVSDTNKETLEEENDQRRANVLNEFLLGHVIKIADTVSKLSQKMTTLEERIAEMENSAATDQKKKKNRRKAIEIQKNYKVIMKIAQCSECEKLYGSDISLNLHLKLKHKGARIEKSAKEPADKFQLPANLLRSIEAEFIKEGMRS